MQLGSRKGACPNCGGPIEFKLGSAGAQICPYCRHSIVRTDREFSSLGKVADLVPTTPGMSVGDRGSVEGNEFVVGGRLQLDHGAGPWDEWYIEFSDRRWAWMAQAQGRWYVTSEVPAEGLPAYQTMAPGQSGVLPGAGSASWTVGERGESVLVSAEGELPLPTTPGERGFYVDLSSPGGGYATIDYGDGNEAPRLYVGRSVPAESVVLTKKAIGPRAEQKVDLGKLSCPVCGAPVPLAVPASTERAACQSCHSLLDLSQGNLKLLAQQSAPRREPALPIGSKGTLDGEELLCIGFMIRSTWVDGERFEWLEHLLYCEGGYRWLVEDSGHFTYVKSIEPGEANVAGLTAKYRGKLYRLFSQVEGTVEYVLGEFYWKVNVGDSAALADYIAPPRILSTERTPRELNISEGRYVSGKELHAAFGVDSVLLPTVGVAAAQPNPHRIAPLAAIGVSLAVALLALFLVFQASQKTTVLVDGALNIPAAQGDPTANRNTATTTPPFTIAEGPTTLAVQLSTTSDNQWIGVGAALIDQNTQRVREFFTEAGYYHGYSGGESWSEGKRYSTVYIGTVPAGTYVMRFDPQWQYFPQPGANAARGLLPPTVRVIATAGKRSSMTFLIAMLLLLFPLILGGWRHAAFEKRRKENSTL
ncbi:MAG: DUF4178 domain-containing protein [Deltaproteobacteria bacterium]|nr:DUF4178 domain-containing protein [Deltaproteobacteria bacterium]